MKKKKWLGMGDRLISSSFAPTTFAASTGPVKMQMNHKVGSPERHFQYAD